MTTQFKMLQTVDPTEYMPLFAITQENNSSYCKCKGIPYEAYIGIKRGHLSWHAAYNRITLFHDIMRDGFEGWIIYLDADAYVYDHTFDLISYLHDKMEVAMIMAPATTEIVPWSVNDGVMLLNFRSETCRRIVMAWKNAFYEQVTDEDLRTSSTAWDVQPDDQQLLQEIIKSLPNEDQRNIFVDRNMTLNYHNGTFIRQSIRAHYQSFEQRLLSCQEDIRSTRRQNM